MKKMFKKLSVMLRKADMVTYCVLAPIGGAIACVMAGIFFFVLFVNFDKLTKEVNVAIVATAILSIAGCIDASKKMFRRIAYYKGILKSM